MYGIKQLAVILTKYHTEKLSALVIQPDTPDFIFTLKQFGFKEQEGYWVLKGSEVNRAMNLLNTFIRSEPLAWEGENGK